MLIDLHIHSDFSSDGEYSVDKIYHEITLRNISLFSVTDHNTVKGVRSFVSQKIDLDNVFIPGIELSCEFEGYEIHLLSYGFNPDDERYDIIEKKFSLLKREQAVKRAKRLKELGFFVSVEEVLEEAVEKAASGVTFLNVLKKYKENMDKLKPYLEGEKSDSPYTNFYFDFFARGGFAYVDVKLLDYFEMVNFLADTFLAVAHPGQYPPDIIGDLILDEIKGIEVFSSYHSDEQKNLFLNFASEKGLIATCGSDFHGPKIKPNVRFIDFELPNGWEKRLIDELVKYKLFGNLSKIGF